MAKAILYLYRALSYFVLIQGSDRWHRTEMLGESTQV